MVSALALLPGLTLAATASSPLISQSDGAIEYLATPPASVKLGDLKSDTSIFVFEEATHHTVRRDLPVDISEPGDYSNKRRPRDKRDWSVLSPSFIPAGTVVHSVYFHVDNETYRDDLSVRGYFSCDGQISVTGSVTFTKPVLGIIGRAYARKNDYLGISNKEVGLESVKYSTANFREFPGINIADGCGTDHFILSEDRMTLTVTNFTDVHHDNYRVILAAE